MAFLNDSDEVLELCQSLRLHSTRANRNRSMGDLQRAERTWSSGNAMPSQPVDLQRGVSRLSQPSLSMRPM